jgi:uncharacterized protein YbcI
VSRAVARDAGHVCRGDMLQFDGGLVNVAAPGDGKLLGVSLETVHNNALVTTVSMIVDADAVYAVTDPHVRRVSETLRLAGASGGHGVAAAPGSEFEVVADSAASEETLLRIRPQHHVVTAGVEPTAPAQARPTGGELNAALVRAMSRVYRDSVGRGPTKAHAFYRDTAVVVLLEDTMTPGEHSLAAGGRADAVLESRAALQEVMRADLVEIVEGLTGCTVRAFMSANHLSPDILSEVFVLDRAVGGVAPVAELD